MAFAGYTLTGNQLLGHIETAVASLGIAPSQGFRRGSMPWMLIRIAGMVVPQWRELARMAYLWTVPHALDGRPLAELSLPSSHTTPGECALRESLIGLGFGSSYEVSSNRRAASIGARFQ